MNDITRVDHMKCRRPGQNRRRHQKNARRNGRDLGTQTAAKEAGDDGTNERQEDCESGYIRHFGSALHHVDVFDRNRSAVAEIDDKNGKADGGFCGGNRQNQHREYLPYEITKLN